MWLVNMKIVDIDGKKKASSKSVNLIKHIHKHKFPAYQRPILASTKTGLPSNLRTIISKNEI